MQTLGDSRMSKIYILGDQAAETISGGKWWGSYSRRTTISMKSAVTNLNQNNSAFNLALGLGGLAAANSSQLNFSGISTSIG